MAHPSPPKGRSYVVTKRGLGSGGRGSVRHAMARGGRVVPVNLRLCADERRLSPAKPLGAKRGELRTAKPCGPGRHCYGQVLRRCGAPNRVNRIVNSKGEGGQKEVWLPGERGISRKAIAQGRPGVPASPVCCCAVLLRVCFAQRTAGASRHPVFPAPFVLRGRDAKRKARAKPAARLRAHVCAKPSVQA